MDQKTGGELLVEALERHGAERVFCVPGESYLAVLDALYDASIPVTVCRQEGGAAMMADAWGKLTGKPGICMVTRGPGATNASAGVHVAAQDSTPMILFIGQIERGMREREAFQEIDYRQMFGGIAKWVAEIDHADRVPEFISRAYHVATSGRPGPVVLALPEDMLVEKADAPQPPAWTQVETHPGLTQMADLQKRLWAAERPIAILGGSRWSEEAVAGFTRFAERFDLPVACSFRRQMLFDNLHPNYAGDVGIGINPKLLARVKSSDLILLVGGRLSEMPSQSYSLLDIPSPTQQLVHVHPDAEELGRVYRPAQAIHASPTAFCKAAEGLQPPSELKGAGEAAKAHQDYLDWSGARPQVPGNLQMAGVMEWLEANLPEDAVCTNGAGNYATWLHRFHRFRRYATQAAPTSGSMGYGLPAAVSAKLAFPEREVVCFAGDGCLQMTMQEFGTACQDGANIIVLVIDNGMYGTIRMHQERTYPGRPSATKLVNPDFAALARSYGVFGETVETTDAFGPAFERARAAGTPAILHLKLDPEAITPAASLSQIRAAAQGK
ncbi:Acetolactate synthase isozyme 2 large subunit [Labrenzia sp. THAF191b]|uniref:thiamine pyrophosphate-binding protein n=1 Tax=unclassified Labrenzia TaxID=2648686 RepID=UPI0012681161|nr:MULTISPECIES: thiamine pyrophosphate-binding protein [unclassified Labrenzia]QFS96052.1 Acetolactate synthase isozyme 2 large subunit [Labrenzia sp. THAF191b]QFT02367.1 Acetolactate synthase isozyme 2 large subunit [Labrenzia sp. THAF191a]QFT13909.1 Acetolactate synthase isozyme 2 large subunit [Labrenzia sp. THAF187b]